MLKTLYKIDKAGIVDTNLFITGSLDKKRPDDSCETPLNVVNNMIQKIWDFQQLRGKVILEPCAGRGGILKGLALKAVTAEVIFNEIDLTKKNLLVEAFTNNNFENFKPVLRNKDSLAKCGPLPVYNGIDIVLMNPPFDNAHAFLQAAFTWVKPGGHIISLFPKYSLTQLTSQPDTWLKLLSARQFSIEDVDFGCGYGAKVVLINIIK